MDSFQDEYSLNLIDYDRIIGDAASTDFYWNNQSCCVEFDGSSAGAGAGALLLENGCSQKSACVELDASSAGAVFLEKGCLQKGELNASSAGAVSIENGSMRKRGRNESCSGAGSKACREKMRRDKMNDRFTDLSSILEPGRPAKTDKSAILNDAIRVLNQLRAEAQELKEANEKLQEDIKNLKAEKNELREEKLVLKADKERIEQQVKGMAVVPGGFVPPHPATYQAGVNKLMTFPSYGGYPMWQWIPPATLDTSQDHVLRPPVA